MRRDDGFTLPELLLAMVIGMIVLLAAAQTLEHVVSASAATQRRVDANQRGRAAMENVVRDLRSQVCLTADWADAANVSPPLRVATTGPTTTAPGGDGTQSVAFYADLQKTAPLKSSTPAPPELRVITFDGAALKLREDIYVPQVTGGKAMYPATPTRSTTLLTDVERSVDKATNQKLPVFRFYKYDASAVPPQPTLGVSPWTAEADTVAKMTVAFTARPTGARPSPNLDTALVEDVFVREVDPYDSSHAPKCT